VSQSITSLFTLNRFQAKNSAYAYFPPGQGNGQFDYDKPFAELAEKAEEEPWEFTRKEGDETGQGVRSTGGNATASSTDNDDPEKQRYFILKNYLNYTFLILARQRRLVRTGDYSFTAFNTGLRTRKGRLPVYAVFHRNNTPGAERFAFHGWLDEYELDRKFVGTTFTSVPTPAKFFAHQNEKIYNPDYEIIPNYPHILDNLDRFPPILRNSPFLAERGIIGAIHLLNRDRDYCEKNAIPCLYVKSNKVQLLLPLYITNNENADLALVLDKDNTKEKYFGVTCLTIRMAYFNARLVNRIGEGWLKA